MILKRKDKDVKKICFNVSNVDYLKFKELSRKANENGFEIELNSEFNKFFKKIIKKVENELSEAIKCDT